MAQPPDTDVDPFGNPREERGFIFFLRVLFGLRVVMLAGTAGAFVGSLLMFWQGYLYVGDAWDILRATGAAHAERQVTVPILEAVDSFLFGVVLIIFAYGIAIGFVFRLPAHIAKRLPAWMKIEGVGQLKQILAEVVIVVLIVIFARVIVESGSEFSWNLLVLPAAIILISGALWFLDLGENRHRREESEARAHTSSEPDHTS
jgi:uncharacterized membrane protein YqhA